MAWLSSPSGREESQGMGLEPAARPQCAARLQPDGLSGSQHVGAGQEQLILIFYLSSGFYASNIELTAAEHRRIKSL